MNVQVEKIPPLAPVLDDNQVIIDLLQEILAELKWMHRDDPIRFFKS